ncbi:MAG: 30S ribosomal protein S4e [Candidatus Methanomethylicia archaeon]
MGRKGPAKHLKRFASPAFWPIPKKAYTFTVRPLPGPHPLDSCIPLLLLVRDMLKYAENASEAIKIIKGGKILVDGKIRIEPKFPVGIMDVISIPSIGENYRILPDPTKGLTLHPISQEEAMFKLCRIENKTMVKGGYIQLNLHDGRNKVIKRINTEEDVYKTLDVIKISIPKQEIINHIKFMEGHQAIIIRGKNIGLYGKILKIEGTGERKSKTVLLEDKDGNVFRTGMEYAFMIGENEPMISLPKW